MGETMIAPISQERKQARRRRKLQMDQDCKKYMGICKCVMPDKKVVIIKDCPKVHYPPCGEEELARRMKNDAARIALATYLPPPVFSPCFPGYRL